MRDVKRGFLILLILLMMTAGGQAETPDNKKDILKKSGPIEIVADRMEAFQKKRMIVFSGHTVATQGDIKLQTDRLSIYYKEKGDSREKIANQDVTVSGDLEKIELKGNVVITQKDISATGDEAVYDAEGSKVVMTGNPVLKQGNNVIKGCRVIIFINENRGRVEQCETGNTGRVSAVIQPPAKK